MRYCAIISFGETTHDLWMFRKTFKSEFIWLRD